MEEVNYYIAFDLKCANAVLVLSTHSGKYACLYCTGLCSLISEDCRTFGSLDYWAQKYKDDRCSHTKMSNYYNVINKRLIYLNENPKKLLINKIALPELHLMMGAVGVLGKVLLFLWKPGFKTWLTCRYIIFQGYHRIGWDGNNSKKILEKYFVGVILNKL